MLYIFLLFINLFQVSAPQQSSRNFELIDTESGLSNNIVFDIYQDKEGFIWMATDNGLNRYDGYNFKKFYHNPSDSTSLSSNIIRKIIEDKQGNLWIGTKNGLNLYNPENESFQRYNMEGDSDFTRVDVHEAVLDKDNRIWFNNLKVFMYFDATTKKFTILDPKFYSHSMTIERDNVIWVKSKWGTLVSVHVDSLKLHKREHYEQSIDKQIHYGQYSNSLWLPEKSLHPSLHISFKVIPRLPGGIEPVELKEIDKHTLLIGSNEGLYQYNDTTKVLEKIALTSSLSALTRQIRSIYKDNNGGIWIGTLGGVFHYDNYKNNFKHIDLNKDAVDVVMGLESLSDGVYANTLGKNIYYKSKNSQQFEKLHKANILLGEELFIWDIEEVPESDYPMWMSTNVGLICYNAKQNRKRKIKLPFIDAGVEISFDLYNTKDEHMMVGAMGAIHKVDKKSGALLKTYLINDGKNRSTVQKIIEFDERFIFATESDGMFQLDAVTGETRNIRLKEEIEREASVFKTYIWDLHVFQNTLWIGTNRGLFTLKRGGRIATPVFKNNRIIFSIEHDKNGILWMGTERGLMSYDTTTKMVHQYGKLDGLKNVEYNRRSITKTEDGKLWIGGVNGITVFDPLKIQENSIIPPVHITDFKVITVDSTIVIPHRSEKIILPHRENTIELDYVALNFTNSSQNQYRHKMIGHDPNWVSSQSRKARYVQLPTGEYTFKVIAANNNGLWNEVGDQIQIQILPPYWETWWFRSIIILTIAFLMFLLYKYRVNKLLEMERMKLRIASDLHDEVGSGLSGIALTSDILEQQVHHGEIKPHLVSRITKNARNLASTLDDIVWLINPEKESFGDFVIKTKTIAQELLPNTQISFEEEISEGIRNKILHSELKRNLLLFVKEVINNIAKHAEATSVIIRYTTEDKIFKLEIRDNGKGFDPNQPTSGNGLVSIKNRASEIKGILKINSSANSGTVVSIAVKIP